jgi:hypothetical protein
MTDFVRQLWTWIVLLWNGKPRPQPETLEQPDSVEAPAPSKFAEGWTAAAAPLPSGLAKGMRLVAEGKRQKGDPPYPLDNQGVGQFYFRERILDQLPEYFRILKRMRKHDPEAYALYSRVGAHIMPYWLPITDDEFNELSPWWRVNRPSFGAVALLEGKPSDPDAKTICPSFFYFSKFNGDKPLLDCEPYSNGDIYSCTAYFHDNREKGMRKYFGAVPAFFYVGVSQGGTVTILKQLLSSRVKVQTKHRHCAPGCDPENRGTKFYLNRQHWGINPMFEEWMLSDEVRAKKLFASPQAHMRELFLMTANVFEGAQNSMIRVDAQKESMHAVFGVNVERTPYFFKDREVVLNERGNKLRIFHVVRPHNRGNRTMVKMHFRGLREFDWNGYRIKITVPGRDHLMIPEFDVALQEIEDKRRGISQGHLGYMLQQHMTGAPLKQAFKRQDSP